MDIKYKLKNPLLYKYTTIKCRANKKKMKISKFRYLKRFLQMPCHYCNTDKGIGLDRIDNSKGYIYTNVLPACGSCNMTRNFSWTVEETKAMILLALKMREK